MTTDLPPRYIAGTVHCVNKDGSFQGLLKLGWGVRFVTRVDIEGVNLRHLPRAQHDRAMHCLLVLLGGKDFYALVPYVDGGPTLARVFVPTRVKGENAPTIVRVPGVPSLVLSVAEFFHNLAQSDYDVTLVKRALNGGGA